MSRLGVSLSRILTGGGAAISWMIQYVPPFAWTMGPAGRWWEPIRRLASRWLGRIDRRLGPRPITEAEYAGTLTRSLDAIEADLAARGCRRNPFSRLKVRDNTAECASWVYRPHPTARQQLHFMLFCHADGIDIYAHAEPSSANPRVGADHVTGTGQNVAAGVAHARRWFSFDHIRATPQPPAGPWSTASAGSDSSR